MKCFICTFFLILFSTLLLCIDVSGHISCDTIWTPGNNPYIVTAFLYVDAGVTLTIQPGVQVYVVGADKNNINNFMWNGTNQPLAKMIIVNGAIKSIGSVSNPILFNKYGQGNDIRWGGIYMTANAPISTFEFCEFRNSFFCEYVPGEWSLAALEFANGSILVRNTIFDTNLHSLGTSYLSADLLIYNCQFRNSDNLYPAPFAYGSTYISISASLSPVPVENYKVTIAKCLFTGLGTFMSSSYHTNVLLLNNIFDNFQTSDNQREILRTDYGSSSSYGNTTINGKKGWGCYSATATDTVYARRNRLLKPVNSNPLNYPLALGSSGFGTNYVSDNYLSGYVQVNTTQTNITNTHIYNNFIETNCPQALYFDSDLTATANGQMRFYNNFVKYIGNGSTPLIMYTRDASPYVYNNTFINFHTLHSSSGVCDEVLANNIIDFSYWSSGGMTIDHHPMLYNNCIGMLFTPPWDIMDGGGNISADPMFADSLNGDYSLQQDSPCVDTGMFRPDLPNFDISYKHRIVQGSVNSPDSVDMGAYEFNSSYIGGIIGNIYDSISGLPVDCAKIEITGKLPEFTDTLGTFNYPTGAGAYSILVSRWDYQDYIIHNVVVNEGNNTELNISLQPVTVSNDDNIQNNSLNSFTLFIYPNPFSSITNIGFTLTKHENVSLSIYNIKGQLVKKVINDTKAPGNYLIKWDGKDFTGRSASSGLYLYKFHIDKSHILIILSLETLKGTPASDFEPGS